MPPEPNLDELCLRNNSGIAILEAALSITLFLSMVLFIYEAGIALYRRSLLEHATMHVARQVAVSTGSVGLPINCPAFVAAANTRGQAYMNLTYGVNDPGLSFSASVTEDQGSCYLTLTGSWPLTCTFCKYISGAVLKSSSRSLIENTCFVCTTCP